MSTMDNVLENLYRPYTRGYSRFFASCGDFHIPNQNAFIIEDAVEFWMERLRYRQMANGKCCCILNADDNFKTPIACDNTPHLFKSGYTDPFGYCTSHLIYRKTHAEKYLGFNPIRVGRMKRRRQRKLKTLIKMPVGEWEEEDIVVALRSLKRSQQ